MPYKVGRLCWEELRWLQVGGVAPTPANTASCSYLPLACFHQSQTIIDKFWHFGQILQWTMATKILLWDTSQSVYLFILLTSVMMSVASGVDLMEWKTLHLQRVSQQDDGKSLLLEPGELTSWRGDTRHQLERLETARVGRGSTTISQLARPTLQPAHHSRDIQLLQDSCIAAASHNIQTTESCTSKL